MEAASELRLSVGGHASRSPQRIGRRIRKCSSDEMPRKGNESADGTTIGPDVDDGRGLVHDILGRRMHRTELGI
jgi:hypothetical protein